MPEAMIRTEGLKKSFGTVQALQGVDLEVEPATVFGLLGPNGAGKTTAVRILTTLLAPDEGRAEVAGFDVTRQAESLRHVIGLAGHSIGVWWHQEEPLFSPGEERELQTGMVVCLEPVLKRFWHVQDQLLITDDGPELLSDGFNTDQLFIMGEGHG